MNELFLIENQKNETNVCYKSPVIYIGFGMGILSVLLSFFSSAILLISICRKKKKSYSITIYEKIGDLTQFSIKCLIFSDFFFSLIYFVAIIYQMFFVYFANMDVPQLIVLWIICKFLNKNSTNSRRTHNNIWYVEFNYRILFISGTSVITKRN
jgi:hypothetical protein